MSRLAGVCASVQVLRARRPLRPLPGHLPARVPARPDQTGPLQLPVQVRCSVAACQRGLRRALQSGGGNINASLGAAGSTSAGSKRRRLLTYFGVAACLSAGRATCRSAPAPVILTRACAPPGTTPTSRRPSAAFQTRESTCKLSRGRAARTAGPCCSALQGGASIWCLHACAK